MNYNQALVAIKNADNTVQIEDALNRCAEQYGYELDQSTAYEESLDWYRNEEEGNEQFCEVLEAAIEKWYELEQ